MALMLEDGEELPVPSALQAVAAGKEASTVAVALVSMALPGVRRANVTRE